MVNVLLTVHLSITLVNDQLDAPYMFRPPQKGPDPPRIEAHTIQPINHGHREANQDTATHRTTAGI